MVMETGYMRVQYCNTADKRKSKQAKTFSCQCKAEKNSSVNQSKMLHAFKKCPAEFYATACSPHMGLVRAVHLCFFPSKLAEMSLGSTCKFSPVKIFGMLSVVKISSFARSPRSRIDDDDYDDVSFDSLTCCTTLLHLMTCCTTSVQLLNSLISTITHPYRTLNYRLHSFPSP